MSTGTLISVVEYLNTSYRPDCEYLDGEILERNVGESNHSRLQISLGAFLFFRESQWGIRVFSEQRVQVKAKRFRIPDLCVVVGSWIKEPILTRPPFLCIEILSKDDRMSEMQERINDYIAFGVPFVWVLDPQTQRAYIHTAGGSREVKDGFLKTENPELIVPMSETFWEL